MHCYSGDYGSMQVRSCASRADLTSMKRILYWVDTEGKKAGLLQNGKKTKVLHINGSENSQNIKVNNKNREYVKKFF